MTGGGQDCHTSAAALVRNDEGGQRARWFWMTKGAQRLGLPTGGLSSKARLGSLCVSKLHNVSVE